MKGVSLSVLYTGMWLLLAIFIEYMPWRFVIGNEYYIPDLDVIVAVYAGIFLRVRMSFLLFIGIGLLKDLCFGTPPGMSAAILAVAYIAALSVGRAIMLAPRLRKIIFAACCCAILCIPELIINAWFYGRFPDTHILLARIFSTCCFYPVMHTLLMLTGYKLTTASTKNISRYYTPSKQSF